MGASAVGKFKVCFLPVRIVGEVRTNEDNNLRHFNGNAKAYLKLKILTESAAPRVIGVRAVVRVVTNAVDSVTLKEAGLLASYEIRPSVGEIFRYVVSVMRVDRDQSLGVDLSLCGLCTVNSVAVSRKCAGSIAGLKLSVLRYGKLKYAVGNVDYRLCKSRIKLQLDKLGVAKLNTPLIAALVFTLKALVDLLAVRLELNVAVFSNKL